MFYNPLDPSKDGRNIIADGVRFHIRNSVIKVEEIKDFMKKHLVEVEPRDTAYSLYRDVLRIMGINDHEITIADEKELITWIGNTFIGG